MSHDKVSRIRLDLLLVERGLYPSREKAAAGLLAGEVWSKQTLLTKAGTKVAADVELEVRSRRPAFVSRAGEKLAHALDTLSLDPADRICLDIGASTGGFTDCLLKRGARKVLAVDVGYGQLDSGLRADPRVLVLEKTNARTLDAQRIAEIDPAATSPTLIVADVSFISLRLIVGPMRQAFPSLAHWLLLFKPQFEVGPKFIEKGGRVRDGEAVERSLAEFDRFMQSLRLIKTGEPILSPIRGKKSGNQEILLYYVSPESS